MLVLETYEKVEKIEHYPLQRDDIINVDGTEVTVFKLINDRQNAICVNEEQCRAFYLGNFVVFNEVTCKGLPVFFSDKGKLRKEVQVNKDTKVERKLEAGSEVNCCVEDDDGDYRYATATIKYMNPTVVVIEFKDQSMVAFNTPKSSTVNPNSSIGSMSYTLEDVYWKEVEDEKMS